MNHHIRVLFVSQSGEGKANKTYRCFSKRLEAAVQKGRTKNTEMKAKMGRGVCCSHSHWCKSEETAVKLIGVNLCWSSLRLGELPSERVQYLLGARHQVLSCQDTNYPAVQFTGIDEGSFLGSLHSSLSDSFCDRVSYQE